MATNKNRDILLASQAREFFTSHAVRVLPPLEKILNEKFVALADQIGNAHDMQERREAFFAYQSGSAAWIAGTSKAWKKARANPAFPVSSRSTLDSGKFELIADDAMEGKILASRLALRMLDFVSWELNDLRLRIQNLEGIPELPKDDILRPEVLAEKMLSEWIAAKLSRELWVMVQDQIQLRTSEYLLESYHVTNEFLIRHGVMADIDLRPLVKRTPSGVSTGRGGADSGAGRTSQADLDRLSDHASFDSDRSLGGSSQILRGSGGGSGGSGPSRGSSRDNPDRFTDNATFDSERSSASRPQAKAGRGSDSVRGPTAFDETRMQTATTPLARARMRAQGVMGQIKRLLTNQVSGFDDTRTGQASPQLARALANAQASYRASERTILEDMPGQAYSPAHIEQVAGSLRQQTSNLKRAASTDAEKATIEIVALMFQSILAEERIPTALRVWFARLQMPVLRVAISEPEFFGSLQHPARRLIDRMGSCVLGFEVTVTGGAMEVEIKRVVQVIEQYPETGRRVFQLVYDEFEKFLSKFLSEQGRTARVVSIAQQVEQKETMAIQYTIEMRSMLNDMPVREEIREFLFKVWAEVLAIMAVRNGPQHQETLILKKAASELVWAASAKPNRADRAKVIAELPKLLQLLRSGMSMLNLDLKAQDKHIKVISDTLADAFLSKTDTISAERIDAMSKRLANLEDYLSDEDVGDLPLDNESLVMMIGIEASDIEVITDGGSQPTQAMRAWAQELQVGAWFTLDHNSKVTQVQFSWRSDRKQLHLFASADGRNFLIQARRLAAYLQAGLLVPTEEEALTVRATRDALAKLEANPERLLG